MRHHLGDPAETKSERLKLLKQRAQAVLELHQQVEASGQTQSLEVTKLLEDLRIYQVELELQNEELRLAQQEADLARRRYHSLFQQMPLPAAVVDTNGTIEESNERATILLGERKRFVTLDGRLWQKLNSKDRARFHVALRDVRPGESLVLHQMVIGNTGAQAPVFDAHLIGLSIDYNLDRRVLVLLIDRSAELAREQDQRFFSLLLDSSDSLIYAADKQGKFLLVNQTMLNFLSRTRSEVLGHKRETFLPLRDAIVLTEMDQKVMQTGQTIILEEQIHLGPPRGTLDFLSRKFPLRNLQDQIYGVGGISTDITAIKDQQRQALLSETVFMTSSEAIIITSADTRFVRVNPAFTKQSGFSMTAVLGRRPNILKSGRQNAGFYIKMWQTLLEKGAWSGELSNRRADGGFYTVWSNINAVHDDAGKVMYYIAIQTDMTQLLQAQQRLEHQASYDGLTSLPNRALFKDRISQLIALSQRHHKPFALLFVDIDHFKELNDSLGHQVGDDLLLTVAHRLQECVRTEDTVARMGGDEFVVLLPDTDSAGAQFAANHLLNKLRQPLTLGETTHYCPMASVGVAVFPDDGITPDLLLRNADMAMYGAKMGGRNCAVVYTPQMSKDNDYTFAIQTELAQAIERRQLQVYFQPKFHLSSGEMMGAEALVRWQRPEYGLMMPDEFIPIAEKSGLLHAIDQWVLKESLRQLGFWCQSGLWDSRWHLAVNQSAADLRHPGLISDLQSMFEQFQVRTNLLEIEITEDALLEHTDELIGRLDDLRQLGISLVIDDFGTGYSSLSYLRKLPISAIKIDQSFVKTMLINEGDAVLVQTIIDMAHNLGHTLVAEGIEEEAQRARLISMGCEFGQGYLWGKPISAEEFSASYFAANQQA